MNFFVILCLTVSSVSSASVALARKELECLSNEMVYHKETDECYSLLSQGPCKWGEILVLELPKNDSKLSINPICVKERCRGNPQLGDYIWSCTSTCLGYEDTYNLCDKWQNEEYEMNEFGGGDCRCTRDPPAARLNGDRRNPCYKLYTQGPCQAGEMFVIEEEEDSREGICVEDPCYNETISRRENGALSENQSLTIFEDGRCYELDTPGPCQDGKMFKLQKKPACIYDGPILSSVFQLSRCNYDENGDCQKLVINKKKAHNYLKYLENVILSKK